MKKYTVLLLSFLFILGLTACKEDKIELPDDDQEQGSGNGGDQNPTDTIFSVNTSAASYVWSSSAVIGGSITGNNYSNISEVGVEYLKTLGDEADSILFETYADSIKTATATLGTTWSIGISALNAQTEYAYRAYVKLNSGSLQYGAVKSFTTTEEGSDNGEVYTGEVASDQGLADSYDASDDDYYENTTFSNIITIHYEGNDATINDPSGLAVVQQDGAYVTLNLATNAMSGVEVILSGTSSNGDLKLYSDKKFKITLNGVTLISQRGAAINNQSGKRTFVHLGTEKVNRLGDASTWTNEISTEDCKATFFSEGQLVFSGAGVLLVNGYYKHGIASDDYIRIRPGVTLVVESAAKDGIHTNEAITIDGGLTNITSSSDGIEIDEGPYNMKSGKVIINSVDDAITTSYAGTDATIDHSLNITGGEVNIKTTGVKAQGLKSSGTLSITNGSIIISVSGNASKCISSDGNMTIDGGSFVLNTSGSAYYESSDTHGAACLKTDGNLIINGGTITATSTGKGGKGISADGTLTINNGTMYITTSGSRYSYSNSQTCSPKGIKADGALTINGGYVQVNVNGTGDGTEGIESKTTITITGGEVIVKSYDDGINAAQAINISGGKIYAYASNNDGIDSNGTITISGGLVIGIGTSSPEEGLDCDNNTFKITGGVVIGMGGATSSPTASVCTQYSIIKTISATQNTIMNLSKSDGTSIVTFKFPRTLSSACMLISAPGIENGSYVYSTGGSCTGTPWNGYYPDGTYSGGSQVGTVTVSSVVTGSTSGGGPGGGGGGRP